jgi:urate oxidase
MPVRLGDNSYGKSEIRLVKVTRHPDRHDVHEVHVDVALEGDFDALHVRGDNTGALATDTMRNTVYALAKDQLHDDVEAFGQALVRHFLEVGPTVSRVRIHLVEHPWSRIEVGGRPHEHAFQRGAGGTRVAWVTGSAAGTHVDAGIDELLVLKTTASGWENFLRERYTSLPETSDRILATRVSARWSYGERAVVAWTPAWEGVRRRILETFTDHYSPSVQFTLYRMGEAVLEAQPEIDRIRFSMPNKHHLLYDLSRFGMENRNEIFHASLEPYGLIEGTVERTPETARSSLVGGGSREAADALDPSA